MKTIDKVRFMNCLAKPLVLLALTVPLAFTVQALRAQENLEALEEQAMRQAVLEVAPSVVRIETLGGLEQVQGRLTGTGPTTGLIVSEDGYVISSAFNFVSKPASILITLPGGKRAPAQVVARDHSRMLVLLKVESTQPLPVPTLVPRDEMVVGQWALAVGRIYPGDFPNMSAGILSAINRVWGKAIQTDAKISPSNYGGPLIDIRGRVFGVLVPLSPQGQDEMAGTEWYDSGIGFAIPLADILPRLPKMKQGEDLFPGLMGVSLKGTDIYSLPATIAACPAKSPARTAGIEVGDTIVEIDGAPIERQSQLKHALGRHYAGDTISVAVVRGDAKERIEATLELAKELDPYDQPFLGILPMRHSEPDAAGVVVRHVYEQSPAAQSGLQAGDKLIGVGDTDVSDADSLRETIAGYEPGQTVLVRYARDEQPNSSSVILGRLPTDIPASVPAATDALATSDAARPPVGVVDIAVPESANKCIALVPDNYDAQLPHSLLVWLHAPGKFDQQQLVDRWTARCKSEHLILLAPQSSDPQRWTPTEAEFIRKTMDDAVNRYAIDASRVVVHGDQAGGAMAYLVALGNRDLVRGVAAVNAGLPRRASRPATDPEQRLAILSYKDEDAKTASQIEAGEKALAELKFPVTTRTLGKGNRYLDDDQLAELLRWIDSLDRI